MSICSGRSRTCAQRWMVAAMLSEMSFDDLESTGSGTPLPRERSERLHEWSLPSKTVYCGCCTHFVTPTQSVSKSSPCVRGLPPSKSSVFTYSFFCIVFVPHFVCSHHLQVFSVFTLQSTCRPCLRHETRHRCFNPTELASSRCQPTLLKCIVERRIEIRKENMCETTT